MEDWNAVSKQRAIEDYLREHRVYCKDCDNYNNGYCYLIHAKQYEYAYCDFGTRKVEHVGRSNDTTGTADNTIHNSSLDSQPVICSHPCMDSTCKHHPISAPIDGTTCRYVDCYGSEGCRRK